MHKENSEAILALKAFVQTVGEVDGIAGKIYIYAKEGGRKGRVGERERERLEVEGRVNL